MITDDITNIREYKIIPEEAINFIENLTITAREGKHTINDKIYANIESYTRKSLMEANLESHRKYIDIQLLLSGTERIDYCNTDGLTALQPYDYVKDISFYKRPTAEIGSVILNGRNFAVFFPQDAHAPQITTLELQNNVKKVVVKIAVDFS
jgi:YhcH/YjgK/YiaL family protein